MSVTVRAILYCVEGQYMMRCGTCAEDQRPYLCIVHVKNLLKAGDSSITNVGPVLDVRCEKRGRRREAETVGGHPQVKRGST